MRQRQRSRQAATVLVLVLLPLVVLGILTASNLVSLRALTQLTGITPLSEAVVELRLQAGTQIAETAELGLAVIGGAVLLGAVAGTRWRAARAELSDSRESARAERGEGQH